MSSTWEDQRITLWKPLFKYAKKQGEVAVALAEEFVRGKEDWL